MSEQPPQKYQNPTPTPTQQPTQQSKSIQPVTPWKVRFDKMFSRMEIFGVRAANSVHRGFVNFVLLFILYNGYIFASNYNNYWRLRRDPNIPKQWLEEQEKPGKEDWLLERERVTRDERMLGRKGLKDSKYYD